MREGRRDSRSSQSPHLGGLSAALRAAVEEYVGGGSEGQMILKLVCNRNGALEVTRPHAFKGSERAVSGSPH